TNKASPNVVEGGTLRVGTTSAIDSLNPFVGFQANSFLVWQSMYPYLGTYDNHNHIVPFWAKSWDTSSDGLTWTFHLPSNARWWPAVPSSWSSTARTTSPFSSATPTTGVRSPTSTGSGSRSTRTRTP